MMLDTLEHWNDEREEEGEARLNIGIGVDSGTVVLGDVGSERGILVAGDRGHGQHGRSTASADPLAEHAVGRRGRCGSGGPRIVLGDRRTGVIRGLEDRGEYTLRGRASPVRVWTREVKQIREAAPFEAAFLDSGFSSANKSDAPAPQICARSRIALLKPEPL